MIPLVVRDSPVGRPDAFHEMELNGWSSHQMFARYASSAGHDVITTMSWKADAPMHEDSGRCAMICTGRPIRRSTAAAVIGVQAADRALQVRKGYESEDRVEPIGHVLGSALTTEFALDAAGVPDDASGQDPSGGQPPNPWLNTWRMAPS